MSYLLLRKQECYCQSAGKSQFTYKWLLLVHCKLANSHFVSDMAFFIVAASIVVFSLVSFLV